MIGHGARRADPGAFFTDDAAAAPVLVVRQPGRSRKAFLNWLRPGLGLGG